MARKTKFLVKPNNYTQYDNAHNGCLCCSCCGESRDFNFDGKEYYGIQLIDCEIKTKEFHDTRQYRKDYFVCHNCGESWASGWYELDV